MQYKACSDNAVLGSRRRGKTERDVPMFAPVKERKTELQCLDPSLSKEVALTALAVGHSTCTRSRRRRRCRRRSRRRSRVVSLRRADTNKAGRRRGQKYVLGPSCLVTLPVSAVLLWLLLWRVEDGHDISAVPHVFNSRGGSRLWHEAAVAR